MKPTPEDRRDGLKRKYAITHADGSPCDPDATYFVLRLDYHRDGDNTHITACRAAAWRYADVIQTHLPALSSDLKKMLTAGLTEPESHASESEREINADARRMRWLLSGNGYFMEEAQLCGHSPCSREEKDRARAKIDDAMEAS